MHIEMVDQSNELNVFHQFLVKHTFFIYGQLNVPTAIWRKHQCDTSNQIRFNHSTAIDS